MRTLDKRAMGESLYDGTLVQELTLKYGIQLFHTALEGRIILLKLKAN